MVPARVLLCGERGAAIEPARERGNGRGGNDGEVGDLKDALLRMLFEEDTIRDGPVLLRFRLCPA